MKAFLLALFNKIKLSAFIEKEKITLKDILIINGCYIEHPSRYRVSHQLEQLEFNGISSDKIWYKDLTEDHLGYYRGFIFFRTVYTNFIGDFIKKGRILNKIFFYDIDDLMFDEKEVGKIEYVQKLQGKEKNNYYYGVRNSLKLLKLCDYGITTTKTLRNEMSKHVTEVFINRNVASEEMLKFLTPRGMENSIETKSDRIILSYSSGSITHDPDLEMISGALKNILSEYKNVFLFLNGNISIPKNLSCFTEQLIVKPFVSWRNFYVELKQIDINLAPLEDTKFNRAKSENKWTEASLLKKVTVASDVGAFKDVIKNNNTGILVSNTENDWYNKLKEIIDNSQKRDRIGKNAYEDAIRTHTTVNSGSGFALWILSKLKPSVGFVLPNISISGGVLVVIRHAYFLLEAGYDVYLISMANDKSKRIDTKYGRLNVSSTYRNHYKIKFDKMVATLYTTVEFVRAYIKAEKKYYLVQNYEVDFYQYGNIERIVANSSYKINRDINYKTISKWCQEWLLAKYNQKVDYAPNGIDLTIFQYYKRNWNVEKISILIEGNCLDDYKNVDESFRIVQLLDRQKYKIIYLSYKNKAKKWYYIDKKYFNVPFEKVSEIYKEAHILLKSSLLESFSYPPLEMMATGGMVVVAKNGGNQEYVKHRFNALVYTPGNLKQAAGYIEELTLSNELRVKLQRGGLDTASKRKWENCENQIISLYK